MRGTTSPAFGTPSERGQPPPPSAPPPRGDNLPRLSATPSQRGTGYGLRIEDRFNVG